MSHGVPGTMRQLLQSGWQANPAMRSIMADYVREHAVVATAAGLVAVAFVVASVLAWRRLRTAGRRGGSAPAVPRAACLALASCSAAAGVVISLVAALNARTALAPAGGFAGVVDMLGPQDGPLRQSFGQWLRSGSATPPPLLAAQLHHRVVFQSAKAAVCAVLVVALAALSLWLWRSLVRWSRRGARAAARPGALTRTAALSSGVVTAGLSLLMLVVVVANLASALAPVGKTLAFGPI